MLILVMCIVMCTEAPKLLKSWCAKLYCIVYMLVGTLDTKACEASVKYKNDY